MRSPFTMRYTLSPAANPSAATFDALWLATLTPLCRSASLACTRTAGPELRGRREAALRPPWRGRDRGALGVRGDAPLPPATVSLRGEFGVRGPWCEPCLLGDGESFRMANCARCEGLFPITAVPGGRVSVPVLRVFRVR